MSKPRRVLHVAGVSASDLLTAIHDRERPAEAVFCLPPPGIPVRMSLPASAQAMRATWASHREEEEPVYETGDIERIWHGRSGDSGVRESGLGRLELTASKTIEFSAEGQGSLLITGIAAAYVRLHYAWVGNPTTSMAIVAADLNTSDL